MNGRVIMTFARSWYTVSAIRSLGRRGVDIVAGDEFALTPGSLSQYTRASFRYPNPTEDPEGFLDALEAAIIEHRPSDSEVPYVLMPMHREAYVIAANRERFEPHIRVPLAESEAIESVRHKARLLDIARKLDIAVPRTWRPADDGELSELASSIDYPVFVKVPTGAAGVGVEKVDGPDALLQVHRKLVDDHALVGEDRPLIQAAVPGDDYCTTLICSGGQSRAGLTYRNVFNFPSDGGPGAVRESVEAPRLDAIAARLLRAMSWKGVAQVDFRWTGDPDDEPMLIEVNPRFFGGLSHTIESGVDYPWYLYQLAAFDRIEVDESPDLETRTEAPVVGLLATAAEMINFDDSADSLGTAWEQAKAALRGSAPLGRTLRDLASVVGQSFTLDERIEHAKRVLEQNRENVSELIDSDDPLPALGLVYPVLAFLKRGTLDAGVLSGVDV